MTDPLEAIPHRPPFRLLDRVTLLEPGRIVAETTVRADDELLARVFAGHFPGNPITPGVLLCEMVFQAGAALLAHRGSGPSAGTPMLTRIRDARFREPVRPGACLQIEATITEEIANAAYLKGVVRQGGKDVLRVEFGCALVTAPRSAEESS